MNIFNRARIVIPILVLFLCLFSYLLYRNITRSIGEGVNPPIGVLTFKNRKIQRKFDGEVVWESIPTETLIRNRDTIRTENLSDAILTLEDGTKIDIGENSMILVDFSEKKFNLNFAYGTVGAKKGAGESDILIKAGDSSVSLKSGELSLNKLGEKLDVNIAEGQAKLKVGEEEKSLEKNQTANISAEGVNVKTQKISLLNPKDRIIIRTDTRLANVEFQWQADNSKITNQNLVVATDLGFRRLAFNSNSKGDSISKQLPPGTYYWKILYRDDLGKNSETKVQRFSVIENEAIRLFSPVSSSQIVMNPESPRPISFSWSIIESVSRYKLEISTDKDFNSILESKETNSGSIGIMGLNEGNYFFRVTGLSSSQEIKDSISEVRNFKIITSVTLEPPILVEPQDKKVINIVAIPENGLLFSCRDKVELTGYKFQIAKDINFTSIIKEESTKSNFMRWNPEGEGGNYYWRVVANNSSGTIINSKVHSFTLNERIELSLLKPNLGTKLESPENGKLNFSWKPLPNIGRSKIIVSKNSDFSSTIAESMISGSGISLQIPGSGEFFWKIVWEGNGIKAESTVNNFFLTIPIDMPRIISPKPGSQVDMTKNDYLLLQWSEVKDSSGYIVRLFDIMGLNELEILNTRSITNSIRFTELTKLNQGKFRLEVKAVGKSFDGSIMESKIDRSEFTITLQSGLSTKILTPRKIYVE